MATKKNLGDGSHLDFPKNCIQSFVLLSQPSRQVIGKQQRALHLALLYSQESPFIAQNRQ
jgi:hypothetical protein